MFLFNFSKDGSKYTIFNFSGALTVFKDNTKLTSFTSFNSLISFLGI